MTDLCPWQNSDIKLQHLIRQPPTIKKRPHQKYSISEGAISSDHLNPPPISQIFLPKNRMPRFRRFKTSALGPTQGSLKLIQQKRSLTKIIKQTLDIKFDQEEEGYGRLIQPQPIKRKDLEILERQRVRQRDIIKQQLASIFLKESSGNKSDGGDVGFNNSKNYKEMGRGSFRSNTEIFLPLKLLNNQKRQDSLVLPKIKLGNKFVGTKGKKEKEKEKMCRDRRYFFEEHESLDLATYRFG